MNLKEQRAAAAKAAGDIVAKARQEVRELTDAESTEVDQHLKTIEDLDVKIKKADEAQDRLSRLATLTPEAKAAGIPSDDTKDESAATLGEHFVKTVGSQFKASRGIGGATVTSPEWTGPSKASSDTHVIGSVFQSPVLTQFDRTIIQGNRPQLVVADLLGSGVMGANTNAVSYFIEGALEGAFTTVAEAGAKPQLHVVDPTLATDALKKIAGYLKFTDEMTEDLDFFVSEINERGLYELARFEEAQLLLGNGSGTNVLGLLNRSGIQTEVRGSTAGGDNMQDTIFRAITKIGTNSGLQADGIMISPADYQTLRLGKDANGQYYGGGYFQGAYGVGGVATQPPLWGLTTIVTPALTAGTVAVGAFKASATVYRKGGIRVESTNSHASDFTSNLVTTRIEERVALAVRRPLGICKVTTTAVA